MSCPLPKDTPDIRLALHNRLMRKIEHKKALPEDADLIGVCDGTYHWGFVGWGPGVQHGKWLTEYVSGKCPDVAVVERSEFVERHGGGEKTFSNFIVTDENREPYSKVLNWRGTDSKTLILQGATGRGKTHLAKAVQSDFLLDYERTAVIAAAELYEVFIKAMPTNKEYDVDAMQTLAEIREAALFILDDLGAERQTSGTFFHEQLLKLLNSLTGRMIITTNLMQNEFEKRYDAKITSRLMERAVVVRVFGKDYRRQ
jgi:DNA replication protein DnaC